MATSQRKTPARSTKKPARKPATRRPATAGPPSLTMAHAKGFAFGAIAGLLIGAGGVVYLTKQSATGGPQASSDNDGSALITDSDPKPRFDFYTVLPNQNLDLGGDIEPAELATSTEERARYLLQAGSFRLQKDADRRRGELALLGLEASIEESRNDNGLWFRVYIGPFESRSAMAEARSITAQQSIDTLLLKRPAPPR